MSIKLAIKEMKSSYESYTLTLHPTKALDLNLDNRKLAYVKFGCQSCFVDILLDSNESDEKIFLSSNVIEKLRIPKFANFHIKVNKNEINFGPYIGLLISSAEKNLTTSRLNKLKIYVKEFAHIHGAVIAFALNNVNTSERLIEGYCYNPEEDIWIKGTFPYPSAIYRTIGLSMEWKNHFLSIIGDKIFNNYYFSKWKMYQWFSNPINSISPHIPYSMLYENPNQLLEFLNKYNNVYIKPISGLRGRGIFQITMENEQITFKSNQNGETQTYICENTENAKRHIEKSFGRGTYLIQQGINLLKHNDGIMDFRCIMQKNRLNQWVCMAVIGRLGPSGGIVSNISSGGAAYTAICLLEKLKSPINTNSWDFKRKLESLAIDTCNQLDTFGINCGSLGLDIGIDINGQFWLIEINNRDPDPTIALDIHDEELYFDLKTGPLWYGKWLSGF